MVFNAARSAYVYTIKHLASQKCISPAGNGHNGTTAELVSTCIGEDLLFASCVPLEVPTPTCDAICGCDHRNHDLFKSGIVVFRHILTGKFMSLGGGTTFVAEAAGAVFRLVC